MVTVIIILVLIIVAVIGKFLLDRKKLLDNIKQQGGMEKKYEILIATMLRDPAMELEEITADVITILFKGEASVGLTSIVQRFDSITVQWRWKSVAGEVSGQLELSEHLDQTLMAEKINEAIQIGIKKYLGNKFGNNG